MKKLDVQISKITEVKILFTMEMISYTCIFILNKQAIFSFCLDLFYYTDNINELLACILKQETRETIHLENGLLIQSLKKYLSKN